MNEIFKNVVAVWILARLYDDTGGITRQDLLKNLCQASFETMSNNDESDSFHESLKQLINSKYIFDASSFTSGITSTIQPQADSGLYKITDKGIVAVRKEFGNKFINIQKHADQLTAIVNKKPTYKKIFEAIKNSSNAVSTGIQLIVKNTPLVLSFITDAELPKS